jgi:hypothetical protein
MMPPQEQEWGHSLASASVAPITPQKAALGSTASELKQAHS